MLYLEILLLSGLAWILDLISVTSLNIYNSLSYSSAVIGSICIGPKDNGRYHDITMGKAVYDSFAFKFKC